MTGAFCFYEYDSTSYKVVNPIQIKSNIPKSGTQKGGTHPHGAYGDLHWMVFHLSAPKVHINVEWVKQKTPRMWGLM